MKKNVIISGAGGNLGRSVTQVFINANYQVATTLMAHEKENFQQNFPTADGQVVDLTDEAAAKHFADAVYEKYGSIDAAVMLVGGFSMGSIAETGQAELRKMYSLNFETAYFLARPVFEHMKKQAKGGSLVLIGARPALEPAAGKGLVAYALSKSLLFQLAAILNEEGKSHNIRCIVLTPSIIDTPPNRASMPDADFTKWVTAPQLADLILFACSDTGAVLRDPIFKAYGGL